MCIAQKPHGTEGPTPHISMHNFPPHLEDTAGCLSHLQDPTHANSPMVQLKHLLSAANNHAKLPLPTAHAPYCPCLERRATCTAHSCKPGMHALTRKTQGKTLQLVHV